MLMKPPPKTRLKPKSGSDGQPATTREMILWPVAERREPVRRTNGGDDERARIERTRERWLEKSKQSLTGHSAKQDHDIEWQIPSDVDFMDPRPVIRLEPIVMPDGTVVDLNDPRAFRPPQPPRYRFHKHFDYGLLREVPDTLQYDMHDPKTKTWYRIQFNPFSASMSPIGIGRAEELADGGDLYAENVVGQA